MPGPRIQFANSPIVRNASLGAVVAIRRPVATGPFICALVVAGSLMPLHSAQGATPQEALDAYRRHNEGDLQPLNRAGRYLLAEPTAAFEVPSVLDVAPNFRTLEETASPDDDSALILNDPDPTPEPSPAPAPVSDAINVPIAAPVVTESEALTLLLNEIRGLRTDLQALSATVSERL